MQCLHLSLESGGEDLHAIIFLAQNDGVLLVLALVRHPGGEVAGGDEGRQHLLRLRLLGSLLGLLLLGAAACRAACRGLGGRRGRQRGRRGWPGSLNRCKDLVPRGLGKVTVALYMVLHVCGRWAEHG